MDKKAIILLLSFFVLVNCQVPPKPVWPDQFVVPFGLNMASAGIKNESSMFYSNWQIQAQLVDYPTKCIDFNEASVTQPCKIWFLPAGIYISIPDQQICCMWFPGVPAVPPDFLRAFNYTGIESVYDQFGVNRTCDRWDGEGFAYWTEVKTGFDVQFRDGPGDTFWNFGDLVADKQDPSIFDLPPKCGGDCPASISNAASLLQTSFFFSH